MSINALAGIGLECDDIDVVVCSHLHPDHCGCNTFFKRATFIIHAKEIEAARAPGAEAAGYIAAEWEQPAPTDTIDGERDLFGDGRIVLIPLPGHTPGSTGALVDARKVRNVPARLRHRQPALDARYRHHSAQHLERRRAGQVARRGQAHRGARRHRCCAATTTRNGRPCAKAPTPMNDAPEIHARPKIVGARIKRTEDPRLLTGLGAYTDDRQVMRVLHVAFRRSDQSHARIRSIDCSAARAAPGVVAVFTAEDLSAAVQPLVATSRMQNYYATPLLPLARGKVRYVGEPVVGIIAAEPLSRRGRARTYRHRLRAAACQSATRRRPRVPARRCCMKKPAPTCWSAASSSAATSMRPSQSAPVRVEGRFRMHRKTAARDRAARLSRRI